MERKMTKKANKIIFMAAIALILFTTAFASAVTIKSVETNPSEVAPGQTAKISIEIENTFNEDIKNVNVALDLNENIPIAPYQGSSEENVDEINEGDEEKFTFNIIVLPGAASGIYKIPIAINYEKNNTPESKNSTISLIVNSPAQIKLSAEGYLLKGSEGNIEIRIVNEGLTDLKFVSIQAGQPSGATINSALYEYLGNIDSDDFETVEYSVYAGNLLSSISIPVEIRYKDATNKDYVYQENVKIKVYSAEEAMGLGLVKKPNIIVPVLVTLIPLAYIAYRVRKRIKRKKALGA